MIYEDFSELFCSICEIKQKVVKLSTEELKSFKKEFFQLDFPEWRLQLLWEFIWNDKSYEEIFCIFDRKNLIKKVGDNHGKRQLKLFW